MAQEKRRGASISDKTIATSTALILFIVALFGFLNVVNTSKVFDESGNALAKNTTSGLEKRGMAQTRDLVQSTKSAILQSDYTTLQGLMPEITKEDPEIAYVYVVDKEGTVLAHSDKAMNGKPLADAKELLATRRRWSRRRRAPTAV